MCVWVCGVFFGVAAILLLMEYAQDSNTHLHTHTNAYTTRIKHPTQTVDLSVFKSLHLVCTIWFTYKLNHIRSFHRHIIFAYKIISYKFFFNLTILLWLSWNVSAVFILKWYVQAKDENYQDSQWCFSFFLNHFLFIHFPPIPLSFTWILFFSFWKWQRYNFG